MIKTPQLDFQEKVLEKIKPLSSFALFMYYGTGKTYCLLSWIDYHKDKLLNGVLIIGNKTNILEGNTWPEQINMHSDLSYTIIRGTKSQKIKQLYTKKSLLYLINYDSITSMYLELQKRKFDMVIFDESTKIKNTKAKVTKTAIKLANITPYRAVATGFPITERIEELWPQFYIIDRGQALGTNYYGFLSKYFYKTLYKWKLKKNSAETIISKISYQSVFVKQEDALTLPPIQNQYFALPPTGEQVKYFHDLKTAFELYIKGIKLEYRHILPIMLKLTQICSGFVYDMNKKPIYFTTPKHNALVDILTSLPEKSKKIIWCKYIAEVEKLKEVLKSFHPLVLTTTLLPEELSHTLKLFKDSANDKRLLITTYGLLESGETLTVASYAIHFSYTWSNNVTTNAKKRIYRKGAEIHEKITYIHIYIKNSIEEEILMALKNKNLIQKNIKNYIQTWIKKEDNNKIK